MTLYSNAPSLDLHGIDREYAKILTREFIDDNYKLKNDTAIIIHGIGTGIVKRAVHEELKHNNEDNKLDGYTYKMLNSIKAGNKKEFMDIVIRLHMAIGKDVSPIFIETMQTTGLDFESIGHSFLAGLISNKYEKKEEEKING